MEVGRVEKNILLDFYGELLTERQREVCELHWNEDLSLSEIAEQCGISRQGAWDLLRRSETTLEEIEEKTGLVRRFHEQREAVEALTARCEELLREVPSGKAETLAAALLQGLKDLQT